MHSLAENFDPFSPLIFHLNKKNQKGRKKRPLDLRGLDLATKNKEIPCSQKKHYKALRNSEKLKETQMKF